MTNEFIAKTLLNLNTKGKIPPKDVNILKEYAGLTPTSKIDKTIRPPKSHLPKYILNNIYNIDDKIMYKGEPYVFIKSLDIDKKLNKNNVGEYLKLLKDN